MTPILQIVRCFVEWVLLPLFFRVASACGLYNIFVGDAAFQQGGSSFHLQRKFCVTVLKLVLWLVGFFGLSCFAGTCANCGEDKECKLLGRVCSRCSTYEGTAAVIVYSMRLNVALHVHLMCIATSPLHSLPGTQLLCCF